MKRLVQTILVAVLIWCRTSWAQVEGSSTIAAGVSFSAVSVRPSATGVHRASYKFTADSIVDANNTLSTVISIAYGLADSRALAGLPKWAVEEKFDIEAKVEPADLEKFAALSPPAKSKLLQSVLLERFGLRYHMESRVFPGWALEVYKGRLKLKPTPELQPRGDAKTWAITAQYHLDAKNVTMAELCRMLLSTEAQGLTVDQTNMPGSYDFALSWHREGQDASGDDPDIFTAVKEQIGLQLVPKRLPELVLVVDEVSHPTPN